MQAVWKGSTTSADLIPGLLLKKSSHNAQWSACNLTASLKNQPNKTKTKHHSFYVSHTAVMHLYSWINKPEPQTDAVWPREWGLCYWDCQIHITHGKKRTRAFGPLTGTAKSSQQHLIAARLLPVFRMEQSQPRLPEMKYRHVQLCFSLALLLVWLPAPAVRSEDTTATYLVLGWCSRKTQPRRYLCDPASGSST